MSALTQDPQAAPHRAAVSCALSDGGRHNAEGPETPPTGCPRTGPNASPLTHASVAEAYAFLDRIPSPPAAWCGGVFGPEDDVSHPGLLIRDEWKSLGFRPVALDMPFLTRHHHSKRGRRVRLYDPEGVVPLRRRK